MTHMDPTYSSPSGSQPQKHRLDSAVSASVPVSATAPNRRHRVNWHEAAVCAIEIELRDYAEMLQFLSEYILGKNSYRIDFLIIKKLSGQPIPKNIARIFKTYNLFEIKGVHSSIAASSYYKAIGYAGIFVDQMSREKPCTGLDLSISFLTFHHPRKLLKHLQKERHLTVEKSSPGIYDISKETFETQIIVTSELPPEENLYLHCLTNRLTDSSLLNRLADDYGRHAGQELYRNYLQQLTNAYTNTKGASQMLVCEGLLNLFGTNSEELIAKGKREADEYYLPKINELSASNEQLISSNEQLILSNESLSSRINYLQELLKNNNISFN